MLKRGISLPWDFSLNLFISWDNGRIWVPFPKLLLQVLVEMLTKKAEDPADPLQ